MTIHAIFENGVFRPIGKVDLPDRCAVEFEPRVVAKTVADQIAALRTTDPELADVYDVLGRRYRSGHHDTAERHNEHQP
jgi:predicted DNA-binding antitoxin AbrB/MazE fold protein